MKRILYLLLLLIFVGCNRSVQQKGTAVAGPEFVIESLGTEHKYVRIDSRQPWLLLPVEESAASWTASIIVETAPAGSFTVPLAVDKVDYWVPFDLTPYHGQKLLLSFSKPMARRMADMQEKPREAMAWDLIKLSDTFDTANTELLWRPQYHFTPAYGWMNDPNGMVYKDGEWHLFYQYNPYASIWGNMHWGHAVSKDLVNWEHLPVALYPDALGTIFSGSAVVDVNNTSGFGEGAIVAIYTNSGSRQVQSIAYSTDNGRTFAKYAANPVITADVRDFRDPKVFWNEETGKWNLVLAAGKEVRFYSSPDLKHWEFGSAFGAEYGSHGGVWECPDLFTVPVQGTDAVKWVLLVNNGGGPAGGSATQYFVGEFDGTTFRCDSPAETVKWMDWGKDHYATVSFSNAPDDRKVVMAWMSNWDYANKVPTLQFRSANSIPRDLYLYEKEGECYLSVVPSPEMEAARGEGRSVEPGTVAAETREYDGLLGDLDGVAEIEIDFSATPSAVFGIELFNGVAETVKFCYDLEKAAFSCDRTGSGIVDFHEAFPIKAVAPLEQADTYSLRLFVDKCSVEAFDEKGRFAMSNLVFPHEPYSGMRLSASNGEVQVLSVHVYPINNK